VKIVEAATPAIAVIETDKGLGSGFFVKSDGTLITNSHVIADAKEITVKLKNGETYRRVFIVSVDEQRDLAVLRVEAADVPILPFGNYPGARKRQQSHSNDGTGKSWEQRWPSSRSPGPSHAKGMLDALSLSAVTVTGRLLTAPNRQPDSGLSKANGVFVVAYRAPAHQARRAPPKFFRKSWMIF
jgi:hypothetical protein